MLVSRAHWLDCGPLPLPTHSPHTQPLKVCALQASYAVCMSRWSDAICERCCYCWDDVPGQDAAMVAASVLSSWCGVVNQLVLR